MPQPTQQDFINLTTAMNKLIASLNNSSSGKSQTNKTSAASKANAKTNTTNTGNNANVQANATKQAQLNGGTAGTAYGANFAKTFQKKIQAAKVSVNFAKYIVSGLKMVFAGVMGIVGMVVGIIGMLWQKLIDMWEWYEAVLRKVYDATGLVGSEALRVRDMVVGVTNQYVSLGVTMESAAEAAGAITEEFSNIGVLSAKTLGTVALLKTTMGVADADGAKLVKIFMSMSKYSESQTQSTIASIKQMSIMAKVAPRKVMGDIAKNSEMIYKYFRGSKENATKFAVIINSIGKSMDVMKGAADSLMEWDSSIESEMNASVLLGKSVDFSAARMKVFKGDMSGALDDILKQVGSADKLSKMSIYQHKAIADATGMSTEALIEMVSMKEKMAKFDKDYGSLSGKSLAQQKAILEIAKKRGDLNAQAILTQNIQQTQVEKFKAMQQELKMKFLELAQKFFPIILKVIDGLGVVFNHIGVGIKRIVSALGGGAIQSVANDIGKLVAEVGKFFVDVVVDIILWIVKHKDDIATMFRDVSTFIVKDLIPGLRIVWEKLTGIGKAVEGFFGMFVSGDAKTNKNYWVEMGVLIGAVIIGLKLIPLIKVFGSMIAGAWNATKAVTAVNTATATTGKTAVTAGSKISGFLTNLGVGLRQFMVGLSQGFSALGNPLAMKGIAIVTLAILGMGAALYLAQGAIKAVAGAIVRVVEIIVTNADKVKIILEGLGTFVKDLFSGVATYITAVFSGIATVLSAPFLGVAKIIETVFYGIKSVVKEVGKSVVSVIDSITNSITKLSMIPSGKIGMLATELGALGLAMAGLAVGSVVGKLFGGESLLDQIKELTNYQSQIDKTAISVRSLKDAFTKFTLPSLNSDSLENIKDLIESVAELSADSKFVIQSKVEYNNKELIKKMDDMIKAILDMKLVMDNREVGRILGKNASGTQR